MSHADPRNYQPTNITFGIIAAPECAALPAERSPSRTGAPRTCAWPGETRNRTRRCGRRSQGGGSAPCALMQEPIEGSLVGHFLDYLRLNQNASPHTVRAYESDRRSVRRLPGGRRRSRARSERPGHRGDCRARLSRRSAPRGNFPRLRGTKAGGVAGVRSVLRREGGWRTTRRRSSAPPSARRSSRHICAGRRCHGCSRRPTSTHSAAATARFSSSSMRQGCVSASSLVWISTT